jgi:mRNA interferase MazF
MRRGEIRWYRFARPDKKRPVLVLTRDSALEFLHEVTVAPVTASIRDIPSEVVLTAADGMPRACAVNLDHIQTVPMARVGGLIATLSASPIDLVRNRIQTSPVSVAVESLHPGNLAAAALIFGQFLSERPFSKAVALLGLIIWLVLIGCAVITARRIDS